MFRKNSLTLKTYDLLVDYIEENKDNESLKLPTEDQFSELFQVSRTTIRSVLSLAESKGLVVRVHGSGTFINPSYSSIITPLTQTADLKDVMKQNGYDPILEFRSATIDVKYSEDLKYIYDALLLDHSQSLIRLEHAYSIDSGFCCYFIDYIPTQLFTKTNLKIIEEKELSAFEMIRSFSKNQLVHNKVKIKSVVGKSFISKNLVKITNFNPELAYLKLQSIHYDLNNKPLLYCEEFIDSDKISMELIRS